MSSLTLVIPVSDSLYLSLKCDDSGTNYEYKSLPRYLVQVMDASRPE